jgi:predicted DsbA family dithiol-disulfide isomerase
MSVEQARAAQPQMTDTAAGEGLDFRFDIARAGNTFDVEVGLPEDEVAETLAGQRFAPEVRADEQEAARLGISAVPTFIVDRAIGASGAHPPDALLGLLRQGWERRNPALVVTGGDACGPDGC